MVGFSPSFGFGYTRTKGGGGLVNAEARALVARMAVKPDAPRSALIDALWTSGKANGWLADLDVLCLIGHTSQASLLNWVADQHNASLINSPTFTTDRDFATDGSSSYVDTNFNPATAAGKFARDSALFGVWNRKTGQLPGSIAGWFDSGAPAGVTLLPRNVTDAATIRINQAGFNSAASANGVGLFVADRSGASANTIYRQGSVLGSSATGSTAIISGNLNLGRITASNYAAANFAGWLVGRSMSADRHLSMYQDINTYLTAIGAV